MGIKDQVIEANKSAAKANWRKGTVLDFSNHLDHLQSPFFCLPHKYSAKNTPDSIKGE